MLLPVYGAEARCILSKTGGFIEQAGFTHSLTPARNCTLGCTYCYVPTMGIYGGLKPDDWRRWGQFTTYKSNAPSLLAKELRDGQIIYCSPLVDPYQPAEASREMMPDLLRQLIAKPPKRFVLQTRAPLAMRDLALLQQLAERTTLRVSFTVTTNRDDVRRAYEPHCAPMPERLQAIARFRQAGIAVHATLAPILPCDPEPLIDAILAASGRDIIADPFHIRETKRHGATTRNAAYRIAEHRGEMDWFDPRYQVGVLARLAARAAQSGRRVIPGAEGFRILTTQ